MAKSKKTDAKQGKSSAAKTPNTQQSGFGTEFASENAVQKQKQNGKNN